MPLFQVIAAIAASTLLTPGISYNSEDITVVDGDTLRVDGVSVRISNLDTPERGGRADCDAERYLAAVATKRSDHLVQTSKITIWPEGRADRYDRPLVRVTVDGADWASILISENMAVPWAGRQHDWCGTAK